LNALSKADTGRPSPWVIAFPYAYARELDLPILFRGKDFPLTDVAVA
jgi:hypothetical protein